MIYPVFIPSFAQISFIFLIKTKYFTMANQGAGCFYEATILE